ncbi:phage tail protein [Scytonema hofmannii PCC 7110]|uniref:Phage tail protein n=1 Tax=Scytonema hofmannii PCC 7110 TaxID=128403 RepID=A0A139XC67_9CYAN|nr:phage tail protein [Scytonema hofmannii]KYC42243.1 phage tail protein [Scytonema hofmannii PCC 7110]
MPAQDELLVSCRFYFEADNIQDKLILEVSGLSAESPAAGGDTVLGSGKGAKNLRQAAPTQVKFEPVIVKVVATTNKDLYKWYEDCNKNEGGKSDWKTKRQGASITVYNQAGEPQAKWQLKEAYPTKYEGPQLQAGSNEVANETITLVHTGINRVQ